MNDKPIGNENKSSYCIAISAIILFVYYYFTQELSDKQIVPNLILYAGSVILFMGSYFSADIFLGRLQIRGPQARMLTWLVLVLVGIWSICAYVVEAIPLPWANSPATYLRHNIPACLYALILIASFFCILEILRKKTESSRMIRMSVGIIFVAIETTFVYAPNIFSLDTYHVTAYITSIVNAANHVPYEWWSNCIYGHYGILCYVPVTLLKTLGLNQWTAITMTIAGFACVCFSAETLLIHKMVKNDSVYVLTVIANALINTQIFRGVYYQINPHRILFPALILLLCFYYAESTDAKKAKEKLTLLWIITSASIVWNFETGIICALVSFLVCTYKQCAAVQTIKPGIFLKNIGITALAGFSAFLFVNIYNKLCGGGWLSIREYIYPIGSDSYSIAALYTPIGSPFWGYPFAVALLCGVICYYLLKILFLKADTISLIHTVTAVMGLGVMPYFMNRAVNSNLSISAFEITLALAVCLDRGVHLIQGPDFSIQKMGMKHGLLCIEIFILASMCLSTIGSMGIKLQKHGVSLNAELQEAYLQPLVDELPDSDSIAFCGGRSALLASVLDRDKGIYMIDFEDVNRDGVNWECVYYLRSKLAECEWEYVIIDEKNIDLLPDAYTPIFDHEGFFLYQRTIK